MAQKYEDPLVELQALQHGFLAQSKGNYNGWKSGLGPDLQFGIYP